MKFTDLTSHQRSMLTMLCTGQSFNTDELGRGCNPKLKPDQAASSLLGLRDQGLVYSNQKPANQTYAAWKASQFGQQVFMSRPAEVVQVDPLDLPPSQRPKPYRVLQVSNTNIELFDTSFNDLDTAERFARTTINKASTDTVNYVVTLHKSMRYVPPVAAQVQVEEL